MASYCQTLYLIVNCIKQGYLTLVGWVKRFLRNRTTFQLTLTRGSFSSSLVPECFNKGLAANEHLDGVARTLIKQCCLILITYYRFIFTTVLPYSCRFEPSCSHYATEAIKNVGVLKGGWLTLRRLLRCHPWHPGGYDPAPK